nr:MAG TPA: hypothetical protein [Caudoviricetes sp.]
MQRAFSFTSLRIIISRYRYISIDASYKDSVIS